jgi:AraC family transcriptional regulator
MEPHIVSKPALTFVGLKLHGKLESNRLMQLWNTFGPRMQEIKHVANPKVSYGAMDNYDEATGEYDYVAACEVSSKADIPGDMIAWDVPAQTYAVFTTTLPVVGEVWMNAYQKWLPQSGYQRAPGPEFELYDEKFDPQDPNSKLYIHIPVVSAN